MSESDRKEALLDAAEELIQRMGSNAMSYQHLSDAVGIRKASIHYHFPHKGDLILALQERCEQRYHERYQAIADGPEPAPEKLLSFSRVFAATVRSGKLCIATMLNAEYDTLHDASRQALESTVHKTLEVIAGILSEGLSKGELQFEAKPAEMAYAFFSFLMGGHLIARGTQTLDEFELAAASFVNQLRP